MSAKNPLSNIHSFNLLIIYSEMPTQIEMSFKPSHMII